jgi:superfamily II DNA or RNA helicase
METDVYSYLRTHAAELGSRILETYPPLQSTKDPVAPRIATLLRKALPAQALAITGTAKYLRKAKSARIVAECGAGKTYMALGTIHVLADGRPSTTLVMCPSHITHKWAARQDLSDRGHAQRWRSQETARHLRS